MRYRFGNVTYCEPSRFIDEIDEKYLDYPEEPVARPFGTNTFDAFRNDYHSRTFGEQTNKEKASTINFSPQPKRLIQLNSKLSTSVNSPVDLSLNKSFKEGDFVSHEKFGTGQILSLEGVWPETKATINFEKVGRKNLLLKFARLNKSN